MDLGQQIIAAMNAGFKNGSGSVQRRGRPRPADEPTYADMAAAAAVVQAVFNNRCPDAAEARARAVAAYESADFVVQMRASRAAMREGAEVMECQADWSSRPAYARDIDQLLACDPGPVAATVRGRGPRPPSR